MRDEIPVTEQEEAAWREMERRQATKHQDDLAAAIERLIQGGRRLLTISRMAIVRGHGDQTLHDEARHAWNVLVAQVRNRLEASSVQNATVLGYSTRAGDPCVDPVAMYAQPPSGQSAVTEIDGPRTHVALLKEARRRIAGLSHAWEPLDDPLDGPVLRRLDEAIAALAAPAAPQFDFAAHLQRQREWSERTFGPGARAAGILDHIRKELKEIEAAPGDLIEWIDVVILALDGAWRSGANSAQIIDAMVAKQTKNEGRTWPDWHTMDPNKAIEHTRSGDATPQPAAQTAPAVLQWPRVLGVSRDLHPRCLMVSLAAKPTDDQVRAIHAALTTQGESRG